VQNLRFAVAFSSIAGLAPFEDTAVDVGAQTHEQCGQNNQIVASQAFERHEQIADRIYPVLIRVLSPGRIHTAFGVC
jgi:hypothetical protein